MKQPRPDDELDLELCTKSPLTATPDDDDLFFVYPLADVVDAREEETP